MLIVFCTCKEDAFTAVTMMIAEAAGWRRGRYVPYIGMCLCNRCGMCEIRTKKSLLLADPAWVSSAPCASHACLSVGFRHGHHLEHIQPMTWRQLRHALWAGSCWHFDKVWKLLMHMRICSALHCFALHCVAMRCIAVVYVTCLALPISGH